ncbi:MAG: hypothetical protein IK102_02755 [Treponema sp.]|nr:hypothetical protein [Treponema sp.]
MPQEDYSKLLQTIMALSLEQKMTLLSVLEESLQDNMPNPPKITVSTIEELNQKLDEGLEDINSGNVIPAEVVNQRLHEKYGI